MGYFLIIDPFMDIPWALLGRIIIVFKKAPNMWSVLEHFLIFKPICGSYMGYFSSKTIPFMRRVPTPP